VSAFEIVPESSYFLHNLYIGLVTEDFDFAFAENGLTAYRMGKALASQSFINHVGEEKYKKLVNFILHYIADMDVPIKRSVT
jgi:phosphomannomutase